MTRVVLSTLEFDPQAPVELDVSTESDLAGLQRRVNRVATLDGGAVFNDFGFAHADRTVTLVFSPADAAQAESVQRLLRLYPKITVALPDGLYLAAPETIVRTADEMRFTLLVSSKLST